jgi:hypothetical protein
MKAVRRPLFQAPWEFRESILVTAVTVLAGFLIQFSINGKGIPQPHLPYNALILVLFAVSIISTGVASRDNPTIKWLGGIPLGICLILAIALLSLIGGTVPQASPATSQPASRLGFNAIFSSWPFALTVLFFLANLGIGLSWKLFPFRFKNLQFILFHGGFWIALACGIFGNSDLQRIVVPVTEGKSSSIGFTMESETRAELPFSVFLHDFSIEEYAPNLLLYDPATDTQKDFEARKGMQTEWKGNGIRILDFIPSAIPTADGTLRLAATSEGVPFVKVRITSDGQTEESWIGVSNPSQRPEPVKIGRILALLWPGNPKSFRSAVTLQGENGQTMMANLEVNKPVSFMGWKLYQMGYDEKAGRFSTLSLVEVIHDPWLPTVYLGFFMIMAGAGLFFWNGVKRSKEA